MRKQNEAHAVLSCCSSQHFNTLCVQILCDYCIMHKCKMFVVISITHNANESNCLAMSPSTFTQTQLTHKHPQRHFVTFHLNKCRSENVSLYYQNRLNVFSVHIVMFVRWYVMPHDSNVCTETNTHAHKKNAISYQWQQ